MEHEPDDERPLLHSTRLPPAATAEAGSPEDDHEARARELRNALEELKADLDGRAAPATSAPATSAPATSAPATSAPATSAPATSAPVTSAAPAAPRTSSPEPGGAPPPPAEGPGRSGGHRGGRLALAAVAAVLILAALTGIVRVVAWSVAGAHGVAASGSSDSAGTGPATSPSASVPAAPAPRTPAGGAGPSVTSFPPAPPAIALPPGLARTGPGADAPGSETTALVEAHGSVLVYERLVVRAGVTSVHLAPAAAQALPRDLQRAGFTVTGLRASVDGHGVTPDRDSGGWRVTAPGGAPFTQLVLRYRLAGAVVRATPAPPGRGTLVLRPMTGAEAARAQDPVVVRMRDPRVGQVYCPAGPEPLCDTPRGVEHVATVPAGVVPVVLAQVTLR